MTAKEILSELKSLGRDSYKKVLLNHGVAEPVFGVKIEEMKKIVKRVKKDYRLALDLYDTGVYDAMYLAGLIADDAKMTKKDLERWLAKATSDALAQFTIAWVAAESPHGRELALKWIDSPKENTATAGWSTLSGLVAIKADADLDLAELKRLLQRVQKTIHDAPNLVRYAMNSFVICVGSYVKPLSELALQTAAKIGPVSVDLGNTACKVPGAVEYIRKVEKRGTIGKKRKTVKC
ncbi:MAG: DNA alkylation repair protein [Planctomycetia bacterium]|nr:DNA alkylation repair protein [Planctomycetia bacterium]